MSNRIFDDSYKKFIRGINTERTTVSDIVEYTKSSMDFMAEVVHVGRLEVVVEANANIIDKVPYKVQEILFASRDGYEGELYRMDFMTVNGVSIIMNAYPARGYHWNDEEKDDLYFLCSTFFTLYERARLSEIVKRIAFTDSLTGALNIGGMMRQYGQQRIQINLNDYTVCFMNVKNFKLINRDFSFRQGDKLLGSFVNFVNGFMLPEEMIARLGGDNFITVIRDDRVNDFIKLMNPLGLNIDVDGQRVDVNMSFRMGLYDVCDDVDLGEAISRASTALSVARREGTEDHVWFRKDMREAEFSEKQITYEFRQAIINKEFAVYYQPKVHLKKDELCGCEALVRWKKNGEIIPPMSFIPALEHDGTICELDLYVLETVCRDIRDWIQKDIEPVTVSVNFSKHHLKNENFARQIIAIMERYNVDPRYIEVELTETACYEDYNTLKGFIELMKEHNIKVSIDDFGTGYSSLSLLKDLKVDVIKLDQSFVRSIDEQVGERSVSTEIVIKNIVNMVDELSMEIIAEGVETSEEADFLRDVSCDMAQGYLYDKPMGHDDYETVLRGSRRYKI